MCPFSEAKFADCDAAWGKENPPPCLKVKFAECDAAFGEVNTPACEVNPPACEVDPPACLKRPEKRAHHPAIHCRTSLGEIGGAFIFMRAARY